MVENPVLLTCDLASALCEPPRTELYSVCLSLSPGRALLLFYTVLFCGGKVVLTVFHGALIRPESSVRGCHDRAQLVGDGVKGYAEWSKVERNTCWTLVALPDQECFVVVMFGRLAALVDVCILKSGGEPGVDFVVPSPADAPSHSVFRIHDFSNNLVCGRRLPATRLEVEYTFLASRPVSDLHEPVIVNNRVSGNDSDDGRGDFLPCVQLLLSSGCGGSQS